MDAAPLGQRVLDEVVADDVVAAAVERDPVREDRQLNGVESLRA